MEKMTTDVDLVIELEKRNTDGLYDHIIEQARNGEFHDFQSEHPTPKLYLAEQLALFPDLDDLRKAVVNCHYDE